MKTRKIEKNRKHPKRIKKIIKKQKNKKTTHKRIKKIIKKQKNKKEMKYDEMIIPSCL